MSKHSRPSSPADVLRHPSTKRAKQIDGPDNPYARLQDHNENDERADPKPTAVLHWFRHGDLRMYDNRALAAAATRARDAAVPLLTCYLFSPQDWEFHGIGPAKGDFIREALVGLQAELKTRNIPLVPLTAESRGDKGAVLTDWIKEHNVSHIYANYEYEVDELRRDIKLFERLHDDDGVLLQLLHDQTVVEPGVLNGSGGNPHKVFTPYHEHWVSEVAGDPSLFDIVEAPEGNDKTIADKIKDLFDHDIPAVPASLQFESKDHLKKIRKLWPVGHQAAVDQLEKFLKKKVFHYGVDRSNPAKDGSSRLSPYFSTGMLSIREALCAAQKANDGSAQFDQSGDPGVAAWVRELVFREFYRHTMTITPHVSMNLPKNLKFDFVQWEEDEEGWTKWCEGRTGMPFVDAGMRQLRAEAYMHNRLRMNTASYLRTNLLIDYRRGERYFAEQLVDWDLCNNANGWEPSYTVFNPVSQAERNDPDGAYIQRWVPELKEVEGKAVFDPYHRLDKKEFAKLGYPAPHVDWQESKQRCMQRYKADMADAEP